MRRSTTRLAREGRRRADRLFERFGRELKLARLEAGLTQRRLGDLVGVSQPFVSLVEHGLRRADWSTACSLAAAVGHELSIRTFPVRTVGLRDSGQLVAVEYIVGQAHGSWHARVELPVSRAAMDRRAADLVLIGTEEALHIEVERRVVDFQGQLRRGQSKRVALVELLDRPVRLVIAVPGTRTTRATLSRVELGLRTALPLRSRVIWRSIRSGDRLGADGLLYLPPTHNPGVMRLASSSRKLHSS